MRSLCLALLASALLVPCAAFGQEGTAKPPAPKEEKPIKHPLDPLTEDEIKLAVKVLKDEKKATRRALYSYIGLKEPKKDDVLAYKMGDPFERRVKAIYYEPQTNETVEAMVDLGKKATESRRVVGKHSKVVEEDNRIAERLLRTDPRWQQAVKKRGFDPLDVGIYAFSSRGYLEKKPDGDRYVAAMSYLDDPVDRVELEHLVALVNVTKRKIEWFRDEGGKTIRSDADNYPDNPELMEPTRPAPKPLNISQPEGSTFTITGNEIRWQGWRFRYGADPRTGLVLYTVGWEDANKVRSILYRASLSELFVPYGDPTYMLVHYFDAGDYGLGSDFQGSFAPFNDAPANAKLLPVVTHDHRGRPRTVPGAIALYERDGGILWRHAGESRRARDLVLATMHQAGNYDYCFQWIFHQDGTIEQEVLLSGYMQTRNVEREKDPDAGHASIKGAVGTLVAANIEATNHQHFFSFRIDMDVDGPVKNQIVEMNTEGLDGDGNVLKNAIVMRETPLRTEEAAKRTTNMASHRCWKIVNPAVRNKLNQPSGYMLIPGETAVPYSPPNSFLRQVSGFCDYPFWVTPYDPSQMYVAGEYVFDGAPEDGLKAWTAGNRNIEYEDVVLYYTVGVTHVPRVEEWPIMSCHRAGFKLVPAGFFSSNPAMGVPETKN